MLLGKKFYRSSIFFLCLFCPLVGGVEKVRAKQGALGATEHTAEYMPKQLTRFIDSAYDLSGITVKVLLAEYKPGSLITFSSSQGFGLYDYEHHKELVLAATYASYALACKSDGVWHGQKKICTQSMRFCPYNGVTVHGEKRYQGTICLVKRDNTYLLINHVPLEDYVFSVLRTESWPGWPLEINKVLAIAVRSYILHQMLIASERGLAYHVRNTNHHQTYAGLHECPIARQAVLETTGIFLGYQGMPILAMFDCCCGGVIPGRVTGF